MKMNKGKIRGTGLFLIKLKKQGRSRLDEEYELTFIDKSGRSRVSSDYPYSKVTEDLSDYMNNVEAWKKVE